MTFSEWILPMVKRPILALMTMVIMTMPAWAVGTVNQSLAQIPGSTNFVFTENWTGDAATGSVPATVISGTISIQGFRIVSVEIAPGSPAPTNLYTVTLTDFSGADILGGSGASQSSTTATVLPSLSTAPPIYGSLTVNVTGNSVASAKGSIFVYFAPVSQVIGNTPTGASLTGNNLFTGAQTFQGATTFSGPTTLNGTTVAANMNSIINAALQSGADIGAKINSACTLSAGQTVWVPASSAASFSTTIAPANNIPCHILFDQGTWTYTGSTNFLLYTGNNLVMEGGGSCNGQAAGATCVGGTQFVITNTAANGINCNGCPGAVFARFTLVGPNSGTGIGVIHSGILALYQDVQVRAFGGDGFQISGTRANSNEFRLINVSAMSNKGWGFNTFGTNCNAGLFVTHAGTNTLGNYQSSCTSSNYLANSDGSVTGTGFTFISGATGNNGTLYSEAGNETTCCTFAVGAGSNHFTLTSQATRTDSAVNNEFIIAGQHLFPPASAATPGIVFESDAATGFIPNGAGTWVFSSSGTPQIQIDGSRINQGSGKSYCWSSNANPTLGGCDTGFTREAANTIDIGNSFGGSTNGIIHYTQSELLESAAPAGVASNDLLWGDSTAHWLKMNPNNTGAIAVASTVTTDPLAGTYRVTTDQTITAGASLTNIPGLSWTFPANTALNVKFSCDLLYSQATAAASDSFGFQDVTVAPTNAESYSRADTSATAFTAGNTDAAGVTTAVTVVTFTPSAATTVFGAHIDGLIEQPSNASTSAFNIMAQFTTNNGTIKRGSSCQVF